MADTARSTVGWYEVGFAEGAKAGRRADMKAREACFDPPRLSVPINPKSCRLAGADFLPP
ncbi:hypothetical protein [Pseudorhizobium marinum]|uniref:hypothetical protein n=1 Tax=Pseudorhizobium marinum TaxID=1496690 RepID=UPI0012DFC0ED|nr:hypothetical protein [Pseudorhizobium marinum]